MIKTLVTGAMGKMGRQVVKAITDNPDIALVAAVDKVHEGSDSGVLAYGEKNAVFISSDLEKTISDTKPDVAVDFTQPASVFENTKLYLNNNVRPVIGTTGLSESQIAELKALSIKNNVSCLIAPNFTTGAVLMMMFAQTAAKYFDNAEIIEFHHNQKKDAPSGTAVKTAHMMAASGKSFKEGNCPETELIKGSRGGCSENNIMIHSVRMPGFTASQEVILGAPGQILTIRHDSVDRSCYMPGVIAAVKYVMQNNGFVYGLENIL